MKKIVVCLFTLLSIVTISAQNNTTGSSEQLVIANKASVLIIPFESKMYLSDIDRDLGKENELNSIQSKSVPQILIEMIDCPRF